MNSYRTYAEVATELGFELVEPLRPSTCVVFKAKDLRTGDYVNLKMPHLTYTPAISLWETQHISKENYLLEQIGFCQGVAGKRAFSRIDERRIPVLIKDFIEGRALSKEGVFIQEDNAKVISDAVEYIHSFGFADLDLLAKNVIIRCDGVPFLVDLGRGRKFANSADFRNFREFDLKNLEELLAGRKWARRDIDLISG